MSVRVSIGPLGTLASRLFCVDSIAGVSDGDADRIQADCPLGVDARISVSVHRDDGRLVWGALERWVTGYVRHYYPSDAEVGADAELQQFVRWCASA